MYVTNDKYFSLMSWVFDHTPDIQEYARALKNCGFDTDEIREELEGFCGYDEEEVEEILAGTYNERI